MHDDLRGVEDGAGLSAAKGEARFNMRLKTVGVRNTDGRGEEKAAACFQETGLSCAAEEDRCWKVSWLCVWRGGRGSLEHKLGGNLTLKDRPGKMLCAFVQKIQRMSGNFFEINPGGRQLRGKVTGELIFHGTAHGHVFGYA